jgi:hypothetical protein
MNARWHMLTFVLSATLLVSTVVACQEPGA